MSLNPSLIGRVEKAINGRATAKYLAYLKETHKGLAPLLETAPVAIYVSARQAVTSDLEKYVRNTVKSLATFGHSVIWGCAHAGLMEIVGDEFLKHRGSADKPGTLIGVALEDIPAEEIYTKADIVLRK